ARSVDGVQEMPVSIACSGSYFSVLDFLRRLQQSERLLAIHETRIEQQVQGKDGMLQCQLVVTAYAWSQDETKGRADGEATEETVASLE
ncbi:type 4a pilus biogenesis protein PilO, partial [Mitsuokella multacida]|uniref:type 4a pilus biogenesis protein PilO n=1 Tax=Mitsuokella multacida TaxID=52226 RepID=UPI00242D33D9